MQISDCQSKIKSEKEEYKIDETHTYIIGKYGPVIKQTISEDEVVFKSVKKDIDLNKLKNGEYSLDEIVEENKFTKNVLGRYEDEDIVLKKGKYGLYTSFKGKNISLKSIQKDECEIILDDIINAIKNSGTTNKTIIKEIDDEISIRKGKYGPYVYYKTKNMSKPKFVGLGKQNIDNFIDKFDSLDELKKWANEFKPKKFTKKYNKKN